MARKNIQVSADQARLAGLEKRIESALRAAFADVGTALAEIRDSKLYKTAHKTFEEYVEERWDMSRKRAYDCIAAAAVVSQICDKNMPPPAIESHAAALAAAPEHLRGQVWAKVVEQTGGKPTAKAVTAAAESVTRDYDAAQPVTPEEKAGHGRAYEAARPAGGGQPAYDRAGREAVMAYRREHGMPEPAVPESDSAVPDESTAETGEPAGQPRMSREEAQRRTDEIRESFHRCDMGLLVGLMRGAPPQQVAAGMLESWRRFEKSPDAAGLDAETLSAVRRFAFDPRIEAVLAWPGGELAEQVLSEDDELAAMYRARFGGEEKRLAEPADGDGQAAPAGAADPEPQPADSALDEPEDQPEPDALVPCGSVQAGKVVITAGGERKHLNLPGGGEIEWLCRAHRETLAAELARTAGAEVIPAPGELLSWETGACQYPVAAEVSV